MAFRELISRSEEKNLVSLDHFECEGGYVIKLSGVEHKHRPHHTEILRKRMEFDVIMDVV